MRGFPMNHVVGAPGNLLDGINLKYADEVEDICIDRIKAISPAELLVKEKPGQGHGVAVILDAGSYRTIASSIPLGGLVDGKWPDIRKEMLIRYLEFFGKGVIQLMATAPAHQGTTVPVRLEGKSGDECMLLASLTENYLPCAFGVCRLSTRYLLLIGKGVMPPSERMRFDLFIPRDETLLGLEIHLQALMGKTVIPPKYAQFTNREILTIVE
jgi:hypothetical protein